MKSTARLGLLVVTLVLLLSLVSSSALAAEYTIKLAWAETADPQGHPVSGCVTHFKTILEERSQGRIAVELYAAGQLGDQTSTLQQVEQGIIQSSLCSTGMIAGSYYNNFNMFEVPYMFPNVETAWAIVQPGTEFSTNLAEKTGEASGIRPLALLLEGLRHTSNSKREIRVPSDLAGLKIRTMEVPAHMEMFKAMGASPTPIAWAEVYSALQTGVVDGQENPLFNIVYAKLYEVQDFVTLDGHITLLNTWFMNNEFYKSLPEDLRALVDECVLESSYIHRSMVEAKDEAALQTLLDKGVTITELTPEEHQMFVDATQPVLLDYIRGNMDEPQMLDDLLKIIAETSVQ